MSQVVREMKTTRAVFILVLFTLTIVVLSLSASATISSEGENFADFLEEISGPGWKNPDYARLNDSNFATYKFGVAGSSTVLRLNDFDFSIPTDSVISGIEVKIEKNKYASTENIEDLVVQLIDNGNNTVGTNYAEIGVNWSTSTTYTIYGGDNDTWGWDDVTASDINDQDFGVYFQITSDYIGVALVDFISITVYYSDVYPSQFYGPSCTGNITDNWDSPTNAYSYSAGNALGRDDDLQDYGCFDITESGNVSGMTVHVCGFITRDTETLYCRATFNNGTSWTKWKSFGYDWTTMSNRTVGGVEDQWGVDMFSADFSNENFKLQFQGDMGRVGAYVDEIRVRVYTSDPDFPGGTGSESDPFTITHIEYLYKMRDFADKNFTLQNDLDFQSDSSYLDSSNKPGNITGSGWDPGSTIFTGTFFGNNKTISNLYIERGGTIGVGLFYRVSGSSGYGRISYLFLSNISVNGSQYVGGLVGYAQSGADICCCGVTGNVTGYRSIGGFVGRTDVLWVDNCYARVNVTRRSGSLYVDFGGFVGSSAGSSNYYNNSFSTGAVTYNGASNPTNKGFSGYSSSSTQTECYFDNQTSGQTSSAGSAVGKNTTDMKTLYTFNAWHITDSNLSLNSGYPFLVGQNGSGHTWTWAMTEQWFASGTGEPSDPYIITKIEHLWNVRKHNEETKHFELANDLDFENSSDYQNSTHQSTNITGTGWEILGYSYAKHRSTWDGNNHTIYNLYHNDTSSNYASLFGYVAGGTIQNLHIRDADISGANYSAIFSSYNQDGIIRNCSATGNVTGDLNSGGFQGQALASDTIGCYVIANVTCTRRSGGFVGKTQFSAKFDDCYARTYVTRKSGSTYTEIGGFVGWADSGDFTNCFCVGDVYYEGATDPTSRGFGGSYGATSDIYNCYWDTTVSGITSDAEATGKTTTQLQTWSTFDPEYDIGNSTTTNYNDGYPYLAWQNTSTGGYFWLIYSTGNTPPELTQESCSPTSGVASYTVFFFNISWTDDAQSPADGFLNVYIEEDGGWNTNQTMIWISGSNTSDALYSYSTTLTTGTYNYTIYASDGTNHNSSGPHNYPTVEAQSFSFTIETSSSNDNIYYKDWTITYHTATVGTTEWNVSEDNDSAVIPTLNITNTGNVPLNFTLNWTASPGIGVAMKYNTTFSPPIHGVNELSTSETQVITNLPVSDWDHIWLWMDFTEVSAGSGSQQLRINSSLYSTG